MREREGEIKRDQKKDPGHEVGWECWLKNGNCTENVKQEYNLYEQLGTQIAEGAKKVRGQSNSAGWGKGSQQGGGRTAPVKCRPSPQGT